MAFTKECGCWGCHKQADLPADMTQEDVASAVVTCDDCANADCDPFEQDVDCRAVSEHCIEASHDCGTDEDGCCLECGQRVEGAVVERYPCPRDYCNGEGHLLGVLGRLAHYRCRACGTEFHKNPDA